MKIAIYFSSILNYLSLKSLKRGTAKALPVKACYYWLAYIYILLNDCGTSIYFFNTFKSFVSSDPNLTCKSVSEIKTVALAEVAK